MAPRHLRTEGPPKPLRRLAIVNRGEPAIRALEAVAELNRDGVVPPITTIVVHTTLDADAWFVRMADEAVSIGPATYVDPVDGHRKSTYLDEARVLAALRDVRADAAWVGWGFVAEHASFAERCEEAGIVFVGPASDTIRLLGDKMAAKLLAEKVGVPVVPWSGGPVVDVQDAAEYADRLGYPIVLKASAGGGGRGIRVVCDRGDLPGALSAARAEADLAFGDPAVFMEQLVSRARHVEVQVIADAHGNTWAAGIRDCTIQRRNQKVIEESASTILDATAEDSLKAAAVRIAAAAGYRNAGTVEFLVDPETGRFHFMEVNTRLQVEHPVTEETSGIDLVKLQLHVARGGWLEGDPPAIRGHAVEARLCAEDPEQGFTPAPGRIVRWRPPAGPGIRVDTGVIEGDLVSPEFDSMIAKVVAWGRDRREALARLRRALASTVIVIDGGTTNRSFLLALLGRREVREGHIDNRWLDRLVADGEHVAPANPIAVLQAAIEAYDADHAAAAAAFHAAAGRGRPDLPEEIGHRVRLRYRGRAYRVAVFRTGPDTYRIDTGDTGSEPAEQSGGKNTVVEAHVYRQGDYDRRIVCGDPGSQTAHRVAVVAQGSSFLIDIGETTHRVYREDGGLVRAAFPAFVVAIKVAVGDQVDEGDPVVVLESMKMESTLTAPFGGQVTSVDVAAGTQVAEGEPLLRLRDATSDAMTGDETAGLDFTPLAIHDDDGARGEVRPVYAALRSYLLGFDLDPVAARQIMIDQRRLEATVEPDDPELLAAEEELLDLFADVSGLYRPQPEPAADEPEPASAQEYLLSYLQWLDPERAGIPPAFATRLEKVLARYGVDGLDRTTRLEDAVVWMFRSFRRADELVPAVTTVLERMMRQRARLISAQEPGPGLRPLLDRLATATQSRHRVIADSARDVRFWYFDEPLHERALAEVYAEMEGHLDALSTHPGGSDRDELINRLVWCPQPMRGPLLRRWALGGAEARKAVLEVYIRRFYRTRELTSIGFVHSAGLLLGTADWDESGHESGDVDSTPCHLVVAYTPLADAARVAAAVARHQADVEPDRRVTVDLVTWRPGERPDADAMATELEALLAGCRFGRPLRRLNVTVTSRHGSGAEHHRTLLFTYRQSDEGGFAEESLFRNLHPMIAERAELWRLSNFDLERLRSVEDVYLFRGVAYDNPADVRLFAIAEVRDLTPVRDATGRIVSLPRLERMGLQSLAAMREVMSQLPAGPRPQLNRIMLYVRPPFDVPKEQWRDLARPFASLAMGAGLEKVVLRVSIPAPGGPREAVLHLEGVDEDQVTVRELPVGDSPIRSLTEYQRRLLRAERFGAPYPYEIIRMIAPPEGTPSAFPSGRFVEHDLEDGRLVPVERPHGGNSANLVVGLLTNQTAKVPEGMTRVAILGDPTRSLGSLAEGECRRIIAALDLAERMRVPVEWFALSSGARIAMDSGTENMDWIGAVLRRIIEFTQAGGEINIVVTGINVGAQPYWNAEATMLMHTCGILVMIPGSAMVLTGKQALDFSGGVSAEDNTGIGGFERIMGPNGQAQYAARSLVDACEILLRHYEHTYVVPGERFPRRRPSDDPADRDIRTAPHTVLQDGDFTQVGEIFSTEHNPERKRPFDIRSVMRAVADIDAEPLERWGRWRDAETAVVWDTHIGGIPICLLGLESRPLARRGFVPADGPPAWTSGTLFPQSSRKVARAINAASGNRPVVVLANLSGFDGSPESMYRWQLEYGAEIGRAVTNFAGPIVFVVISRYHGGAFVVFSKRLNPRLEIAAVEGSYASVIGGAPAAAVVFVREVKARTERDPRVASRIESAAVLKRRTELHEFYETVRAEKLREVAADFDGVHSIQRALAVGSVDRIVAAAELRPYIIDALNRGMSAAEG